MLFPTEGAESRDAETGRRDGAEAIAEANIARLIQPVRPQNLRFDERDGNHLADV
jgi:hypothetical protein